MNCIQPIGAGRGDVEVGAEGGLDLVDPGQHRRPLRAEAVGGRGALVDRDQDRRHAGGGAARGRERGDRRSAAGGIGAGRRRLRILRRGVRFAACAFAPSPAPGRGAAAGLRAWRGSRSPAAASVVPCCDRGGRGVGAGGERRAAPASPGGSRSSRSRGLGRAAAPATDRAAARLRSRRPRGSCERAPSSAEHVGDLPAPVLCRCSMSSRSSLVTPTRSSETLTV